MSASWSWIRGFDEVLDIRFEQSRYPLALGTDCLDAIVASLLALEADRYFIVADESVVSLYCGALSARLASGAAVHELVYSGGESEKHLSTVSRLIEWAQEAGATRNSCVVALGGGVVGNVAGMVAALMFRGVRLVHVPTTLVAMLDSVVSLKQAVNTHRGKNLIGVYYQPAGVLADTGMLESLPPEHVRSGLCEVVKNALAIEPASIQQLVELLRPGAPPGKEALLELVRMSVRAKLKVMLDDRRERRTGLALEYGHTVGHAIELESGTLSHGESVGLGMLVAAQLGQSCCGLDEDGRALHWELLSRVGAPVSLPAGVDPDAVIARVLRDNKRGLVPAGGEEIPMVVLSSLGRPKQTRGLPLHLVRMAELIGALESIVTGVERRASSQAVSEPVSRPVGQAVQR